MMGISCIFIIFILLIFTIVIYYAKTNKTTVESFTTPTAVNVPAGGVNNLEGDSFLVGNRYPVKPEEPIVETNGKYQFKKMQLLYDGVWGEKCYLDGRGLERCDWSDKNRQFGKYGTDHFFNLPEKKLEEGEVVVSPPECSYSKLGKSDGGECQDYYYLEKPGFEDVFGFVPQNNRDELSFPLPKLASF